MEQVISHHIASEFSGVPKAYSPLNINTYLSQRDNYRSDYNMKAIFSIANDLDDGDIKIINKDKLDLSIFNPTYPIPYYSTELRNGKKPVRF